MFGPNSSIIFLNSEDDNVKYLGQKLITDTEQDLNRANDMAFLNPHRPRIQIEENEDRGANAFHIDTNSDTRTVLDLSDRDTSAKTFVSDFNKRRKVQINNQTLSHGKRKDFEFIRWGSNQGKHAIMCTSTDKLKKISFSSVKTILNSIDSSCTSTDHVFKIRAEVIVLMTLPQNFTRQTLNGTYEYHFFIRVRDVAGDEMVVLVSGEEGSNFLSGIKPTDFSKDIKKLRQLERRILDFMYTDPQSLVDMSVRKVSEKSNCHAIAGDLFALCDTSITIACDWWRQM